MSHQVWRVRDRPSKSTGGQILLDTHIWLWMLSGQIDRMHPATVALLEDAARSGHIRVSEISCWEVAWKVANGRLSLGMPVDEWLARATRAPGVTMVPLDRDVLVMAALLEGIHGDPADRWIVATAKLRRMTLLTADRALLDFGRRERMTMMADARKRS